MDEAKLEQFMGSMIGRMTGAMVCYGVWLGDELGLHRALAGADPSTPAQLARRAGVHQRLTEEWLRGRAAGAANVACGHGASSSRERHRQPDGGPHVPRLRGVVHAHVAVPRGRVGPRRLRGAGAARRGAILAVRRGRRHADIAVQARV